MLSGLEALVGLSSNDRVKSFLAAQGQHPMGDLHIEVFYDYARDLQCVTVTCSGCERAWGLEINTRAMVEGMRISATNRPMDGCTREVHKFLMGIARTLCYKMSLVAELAEWLTKRVAEAGERGVKYSALVAEAVEEHYCAEHDVDVMLDRLDFDRDWGSEAYAARDDMIAVTHIAGRIVNDYWILLPQGHPQRKGW